MLRLGIALLLCTTLLPNATADDAEFKLLIGDRSLDTRDHLYHCMLVLPADAPIEYVSLVLVDRKGTKVGEMALVIDSIPPPERQVRFSLSHEFIKNSKLLMNRKDSGILPDYKLVIGDYPTRKKEGDKSIEAPIE